MGRIMIFPFNTQLEDPLMIKVAVIIKVCLILLKEKENLELANVIINTILI